MKFGTLLMAVFTVILVTGVILIARGDILLMVVLSGSMEPVMMPGDVLVVTPVPPSQIAVGDIISFHTQSEAGRSSSVTGPLRWTKRRGSSTPRGITTR